jgi:hypothetical protein
MDSAAAGMKPESRREQNRGKESRRDTFAGID